MDGGSRIKHTAAQAAFILLLSAAAAMAVNFHLLGHFLRGDFDRAFIEKDAYPAIRFIGPVEASDLFPPRDESVVFIDARAASAFEQGHVPGALNVPYAAGDTVLPPAVLARPRSGIVVVYCEGADCGSSLGLARILADGGFADVRVVMGGWEEWLKAGLPVEGRT